MTRLRSFVIVVGVVTILSYARLFGVSVRPVNLEEMVVKANRVFQGTCEKSEHKYLASTRVPVIEYTFLVDSAIKGVAPGERVIFRQVHWQDARRSGSPDVPEYQVGQQVLLFLKKDSEAGLTSPVGLRQGAFLVEGKGASAVVMNLDGNRNLTVGMSQARATANGLTPEEYRILGGAGKIRLESFRSMIVRMERARSSGADKKYNSAE
jgi:hypothetical protein